MEPIYGKMENYTPKIDPEKDEVTFKIGQELDSTLKNSDSTDPKLVKKTTKYELDFDKNDTGTVKIPISTIFEKFNGPFFST